jgi:SNF2 family DNA or RNA helicase
MIHWLKKCSNHPALLYHKNITAAADNAAVNFAAKSMLRTHDAAIDAGVTVKLEDTTNGGGGSGGNGGGGGGVGGDGDGEKVNGPLAQWYAQMAAAVAPCFGDDYDADEGPTLASLCMSDGATKATTAAATTPAALAALTAYAAQSGKLTVLLHILQSLRAHDSPATGLSKIVVVSSFVQTLDVLHRVCAWAGHGVLRLDGATRADRRQPLVDRFNNARDDARVFLLSAKAGGQGLNLVGACRLVLYDPDWNPATDLQVRCA